MGVHPASRKKTWWKGKIEGKVSEKQAKSPSTLFKTTRRSSATGLRVGQQSGYLTSLQETSRLLTYSKEKPQSCLTRRKPPRYSEMFLPDSRSCESQAQLMTSTSLLPTTGSKDQQQRQMGRLLSTALTHPSGGKTKELQSARETRSRRGRSWGSP